MPCIDMIPSPDTPLRQARIKAGYKSASQFAAKFGFTDSTYRHHENGTRELPMGTAKIYADKLGVHWQSLYVGVHSNPSTSGTGVNGQRLPQRDTVVNAAVVGDELAILRWPRNLPVRGAASAGDGVYILSEGVIDHLRRPPRLVGVPDAYGLLVSGGSMFPWRKNGDPVYVHPHQPIEIGDKVVVQVRGPDGETVAYIKELVRRTNKELRLRQYNPAEDITIPAKDVLHIHRIMDWPELMGL